MLARGDRRGFILVDQAGEVYSLARQIRMKAAELREFMKGIDPQTLPTAEEAAQLQQQKLEEKKQAGEKQAAEKQIEPATPEPSQPAEQTTAPPARVIQDILNAAAARH